MWRLGKFAPDRDEPVEELAPLWIAEPTRDDVIAYLSQRLSPDEAERCYNGWRKSRERLRPQDS